MPLPLSFHLTLLTATLLCTLIAGFLFAFATVVMPGIRQLPDRDFIQAFQVIDGIIQNNQPIFVATWLGSIVAVIAAAALGFEQLTGTPRLLLLAAPLLYLLGVQLSTFTVNVPLNNQLQTLQTEAMAAPELHTARRAFEPRWNAWNISRTLLACLTSALLLVVLWWL